jgi:hypothetical protein
MQLFVGDPVVDIQFTRSRLVYLVVVQSRSVIGSLLAASLCPLHEWSLTVRGVHK